MIKKNNVIPKKENILIVDDDESTRKTLAFIFNKKGYNVETVGTGHEALEMAQQKSFNLALLDIKLPDIEGIELLVPLKKMHPDMETIMMTAYSSLETVIRALNEGASAYIIKPLNLDDVLNKINSIFERQRLVAEKNKLEQELHYQAMLVENVSDAIISTDINLTIKSWNKAAEIMYGWKSDEIIGKAMSEIIPEEAPYAQNEKVREHIFEKGFWRGEIIQKKKDNTMLNIFSSATLIKDNSGKIQGVVVINRDITKSKKAEAELKKTMKDLKNSNIELEQFAYVASHDLQEPLRMVASFTQLLQDRYKDKLDEDANDFINYAVDGATRMQNLINDLLIFSRVGSRGKPFKIVDMNVVIENVLNNFRQLIKETHSMVIYDPLPVIEADESQMIQLFQNLISNGIKFRGEKDPIIHVTAETKANKWIFTVKDNGIGIDNKFFDRIFIIFQRLHKKSEYGGTGIGLAVCKKIVQRHGGKIWVDSEFGKGSSFHVTIKKRKQARNSVSHSNFRFK